MSLSIAPLLSRGFEPWETNPMSAAMKDSTVHDLRQAIGGAVLEYEPRVKVEAVLHAFGVDLNLVELPSPETVQVCAVIH
jgi:hypothetical protein